MLPVKLNTGIRVCVCVRACVRACVRTCVRVRARRVCVCVCTCLSNTALSEVQYRGISVRTFIYPLIPLVRCLVLTSQKMAAILLQSDIVWSNSGTSRHKTRSVNHTGLLPASFSALLAPPTDHTSITLTPPATSNDVHNPFKAALLCLANT